MNPSFFSQRTARNAGLIESSPKAHDCFTDHTDCKSISRYALQAQKHISICDSQFILRRMDKTPDEKREILRKFIQVNGLKIARWCKESGVDKNSVYNFLNGHSQSLDLRTYGKLARTAEVPVWQISGDKPDAPSPTSIWVSGDVQAGAFREAVQWDEGQWYPVDVPVPDRFKGRAKALEVRGTSMNVDYPEGSIAIWVDVLSFRAPRHNDDVIVYSTCKDGLIEATIKEFRQDENGEWLWPRSHDPLHQAPIDLANPTGNTAEVLVVGIVIGSYRPRHH